MIRLTKGNILQARAEALVNTVNCMGYMGKGIALQFKKAFPANFKAYEQACRAKEVQTGRVFVYATGSMMDPKFIINFPTKQDWRENSKYEYVAEGLKSLLQVIRERGIKSIAIPPLGCGLGGLDWAKVRPMIESAFQSLPQVDLTLFEPAGSPEVRNMPIGTDRPKLTVPRALLIQLMRLYKELDYGLTLLEIQKLGYFLQEAGQPLRYNFEKAIYGPYATNLNRVLENLEGHFIRGYLGSQRPDEEIELLPGAVEEASSF